MLRIALRITYQRRIGRIAAVVAMLLLVMPLVGSSIASPKATIAQEISATSSTFTGTGRYFYLTDDNYATDEVKTACASGYHMASLWEILDVSNLIYDASHPEAHTKDDSGVGPPSYWYGWVRTGYSSSGSSTTGTGNCQNWTSTSSGDYGVSVRLSRTWETAPGDIATWDATKFTCNLTGPVWCVTDVFSVGGTVTGLAGSGLVLQNNGGDDLAIGADGPFTFSTALSDGSAYDVTVKTQPTAPKQTCSVASGNGNLEGADVTDVAVTCVTDKFSVGGTVGGLAGSGLVLQNNGTDDLAIGSDGPFTFPTPLSDGSAYAVTVKTQPAAPKQTCSIANGAGALSGANVDDVEVTCIGSEEYLPQLQR